MALKLDQKLEEKFEGYCSRKDVDPKQCLDYLIRNWCEQQRRSYIIPDERVFGERGY